jgi:hypothetical protein
MREGLRDVRDHFGRWLGVEGRKLALFWNRHETRTNVGKEFVEQFSRVLEWLPGFGVLAVLGVAGLAWLLAEGRLWPAAVVSVFILVPMAVCLLFFVSGEYRHPAALPLCLAAATPLDAAFRTLRRASRVPLLLGLVVGLVSVPLVVHRFPPLARTDHPRLDYANYAKALTTQGMPAVPRALVLLDRGRRIYGADPVLLDATLRVQVLATLRGDDVDQARAAMRTAGQLQAWLAGPDAAAFPERFLQETFTDLGRGMAAVVRSPAVASDPGLLRAGALLGGHGYAEVDALVRGGELDAAARFAQAALAQAPRSAPALTAMGRLAKARGNDSEAASWFRRAMSGWPRIPEPAIELARLFASSGDTPHERLALEDALRRQPGNAAALEMLAALPR